MMDSESLENLEQSLTSGAPSVAPAELRQVVLRKVGRELRRARWDRRLARVAALLLVMGVTANAALALRLDTASVSNFAGHPTRDSLVQVAVSVAEATDPTTGSRFARQLAALSGRELTGDDALAIDAAVGRSAADRDSTTGSEG